MNKSKLSKAAGFKSVLIIKLGCIPSEKSTMISLSFENLKSVRVAAIKKEKGSVKKKTSGRTKIYIFVISQMVSFTTAVNVASLIKNITDAIAKSGKNTDKKSIDK